jgi:hypothetical protein
MDRWCPLCYEFLLEFCYVCGIIGHVDKVCDKKRDGEARLQFDRSLCVIPYQRNRSGEMSSSESRGRKQLPWTSSTSGRQPCYMGSG